MKKNLKVRSLKCPHFKKLLRIMRLVSVLILALALHVSATVYSQQAKLSLNLNNVTIRAVLQQIEDQSKYKFLLQDELLDIDRKIDIRVNEESVEKILEEIFGSNNIRYVITEKKSDYY